MGANTNNIYTTIVLEMQQEIASLRKGRKPVTPFMHEKVKPSVSLDRSTKMTRAQREETIQGMGGDEAFLKVLRGGRNG